jgi:YidC/Oxa1 family membrane protein insertase
MDIQRTLLIGAALLLSFMLVSEWVAFKAEKATPAAEMARLTADGPAAMQSAAALPAVETSAALDDELPQAPASVETANPASEPVASDPGRIVSVYTDTLEVAIDLEGGDIVEVALPRFRAELDDPNTPFLLLENSGRRTYIAQSGLIGPDGIDRGGRARFSATQPRYELAGGDDRLSVDLTWNNDAGIKVTKRFTFTRNSYVVDVKYIVVNNGDTRWQGNLFGQIKRDSSPAPSADSSGMGMQPFLGAATTTPDDRFKKFSFDKMRDDPFKEQLSGGWIAMIQHYFLSAWIPNPDQAHSYSTRVTNSGFNIAGFVSPATIVDPGQQGSVAARFYAGPKDQYSLEKISPYLELSVDYGWLWWVAQPLFWLLTKIHALVANWGVAIILLTMLIKAAFFKLSATSYKSMAKMRQVQPKIQSIREEYADDKQKQSQAMMDLYRKEKINPMGGCLPILVQMPVFIGLYWMLMESVELRHAPFMLWINDLSVMDPYFVLPVLMGASMYFMQKLNPPPPDPMQAKIMQWLPVIFTFFFLWFPAGLVLYWLVNNLLSMAQQYVITRQIEKGSIR